MQLVVVGGTDFVWRHPVDVGDASIMAGVPDDGPFAASDLRRALLPGPGA
jgi:hypothetical protein